MYNNIQTFKNKTFGELQIIMIDGEPYFPATECAKVLGYSKGRNAIAQHCRYALKQGVPHPQSPTKIIEKLYIPESDLYRLITHSKLPSAKKFEKFVYETVLPSIRRHGAYIAPDTLEKIRKNPKFAEELIKKLHDEQSKNGLLERHISELEPKAIFCDDVLSCGNAIPVSIIAKDYGMTPAAFNKLLHDLRIQYKIGKTWLLYKELSGKGYTKTRIYPVSETESAIHTYWTFEGYKFLYEFLKYYGIKPSYVNNRNEEIPF